MRSFFSRPALACHAAVALLTFLALSPSSSNAAEAATGAPVVGAPADGLRPAAERFADLDKGPAPSFRRHVIPMMARAGCSGRECHGSFQGRGGFRLSLFGSEWDADHVAITQTKGGADLIRVDLKDPEQSLILLKPTAQVEHKGKERIKKGSWEYNLLLKWIRDGAKNDADQTGELQSLDVSPKELQFAKPGDMAQLRVLARWRDGTVEDVSQLTRFKSNDETVASVSETGLVTCTGKGDSHIVASYDSAVQPVPVLLAVSDKAGPNFPTIAAKTRVDELVLNKLRKVGIVPSETCTDPEFLRRISLDLTGTLPSPEAVTAFLSDSSPNKRSAKIEELLKTPAYTAWWTTRLCDYTGNSARGINIGGNIGRNGSEFSRQWYEWIYKRVADNTPYDQLVAGIVLATSRTSPQQSYKDYAVEMSSYFRSEHPADFADHPTLPYFWQRRTVNTPQEKALAFTHAFLGVRLECAQCHKHPFDRWTKKDFEQFTAFFTPISTGPRGGQVAKKGGQAKSADAAKDDKDDAAQEMTYQSLTQQIKDQVAKEIAGKEKEADPKKVQQLEQKALQAEIKRRLDAGEPVPWPELYVNYGARPKPVKGAPPTKNGPVTPKILGGEELTLDGSTDPRQPLMDWMRDKSNPYFAKAFVNRVWANYFGRGIVDPPDDLNRANGPANAELLAYLSHGFIDHNFDMRWLHREICNSDTYQRSWRTNETNKLDARNFSHAAIRQLPAEVMLDALEMAFASDERRAELTASIDERAIGPGSTVNSGKGKAGRGGGETYALTLFGKPLRETNCDCERSADPTLLQTLYTLNDPTVLGRIEAQGSWVAGLRRTNGSKANQADADSLVTAAFLRTVSRPPTEQELEQGRNDLASAKTPADGVRDLLWALINTREFKVNH